MCYLLHHQAPFDLIYKNNSFFDRFYLYNISEDNRCTGLEEEEIGAFHSRFCSDAIKVSTWSHAILGFAVVV